jgi:hypothetical protein
MAWLGMSIAWMSLLLPDTQMIIRKAVLVMKGTGCKQRAVDSIQGAVEKWRQVNDARGVGGLTSYAFTDDKSQGQTIECVIVDLGKPPWGALTAFNTYVALSQSRGHGRVQITIRLLWDFEDKLFTTHPSEELRDKDDRLEELTEVTRIKFEWGDYVVWVR